MRDHFALALAVAAIAASFTLAPTVQARQYTETCWNDYCPGLAASCTGAYSQINYPDGLVWGVCIHNG